MVLARCLATTAGRGSVAQALQRYQQLRMARTRGVQQRSLWLGAIGQWQSSVMVASRRVVTSLLPAPIQPGQTTPRNFRGVRTV